MLKIHAQTPCLVSDSKPLTVYSSTQVVHAKAPSPQAHLTYRTIGSNRHALTLPTYRTSKYPEQPVYHLPTAFCIRCIAALSSVSISCQVQRQTKLSTPLASLALSRSVRSWKSHISESMVAHRLQVAAILSRPSAESPSGSFSFRAAPAEPIPNQNSNQSCKSSHYLRIITIGNHSHYY